MQISNTNGTQNESLHWVNVKKPLAYDNLAANSYSLQNNSGKVTVFLSRKQKMTNGGSPSLCVSVPGFTGDADTHDRLIKKALNNGIGVICATPTWTSRTAEMGANFGSLFEELQKGPIDLRGLEFIRANSFGAHLALGWIDKFGVQIKKVALITPCSSRQLPRAGAVIQREVQDDSITTMISSHNTAAVRIILLAKDSIVPETDNVFLSISTNTQLITLNSFDHFGAGDLKEAAEDVADWFAEGL